MKGIIDIINETDGNTDEDLLVYSMTLVNKVLTNSIAVIFMKFLNLQSCRYSLLMPFRYVHFT